MLRSRLARRLAEVGFAIGDRVAPPFMFDCARHLFSEWERRPEGWVEGAGIKGWDEKSVADAQARHWPILCRNVEGSGPLGVSHLPTHLSRYDPGDHNTVMSYAYVLALASHHRDRLAILDWGGGLGHYYMYSRALLPDVALDFDCYDVPILCNLGRTVSPEVTFHEDVADLRERTFDLVVSSSSLHYFRDWRATLQRLIEATGTFLYVARLQTVLHEPTFVALQRPHRSGYFTEYLSWFLNREEFLDCVASKGMEVIREFVYAEQWRVRGCHEVGVSRGFLLRPNVPAAT